MLSALHYVCIYEDVVINTHFLLIKSGCGQLRSEAEWGKHT